MNSDFGIAEAAQILGRGILRKRLRDKSSSMKLKRSSCNELDSFTEKSVNDNHKTETKVENR